MTRIVAGFAGNLTLAVPKSGTRPTSDRVREAIFSALDSRDAIAHTRVLDLYAGSGGLGLEAASRGARSVTLVEKNSTAAALCRKNAEAISKRAPSRDAPRILVTGQSVQAFLNSSTTEVDLVFIDPPYELTDEDLAQNLATLATLLSDDALVVVERSTRSPEPDWGDALVLVNRKKYGETTVWYAETATR
ncbi:16S rRNA (guanine(966)-N(2))-methyltransferase RsmD [Glaciibacter psychrotolerans]|uniref:16S rRNA (Guanine966-N2)-methyltransferase n=1 Tax=Glaciibacter psychrotolerans TaxID=670054 RepID=A0A7Z0J616_9MICO|nr:16S rRNA (guanine(966)-N(2))-methyltransferase RsmD [Leifsonia psychrotolerans]NYJ19474.1 16S rRNA (guanine966-N2)-methyltransferase [Leifsonia psychrotolerans]